MLAMNNEASSYKAAIEQVGRIKSFYQFALKGLVLCVLLVLLNAVINHEYMWSLWVLAGWSILFVLRWISCFGFPSFFDRDWEKKQIDKRLSKMNK
ncbi:hypothetical protein DS891_14805 [Pseudoalteromonas sp. JC28]|nr:hypothetical protein [Pseudoalteromonas sp. JC28]